MFKRSLSVEVTPKSPEFSARYLGKREAPIARGRGCTQELMKAMWDDVANERQLPKVRLTIHRKTLDLTWVGSKDCEPQQIPMQAVTYCSVDRAVNSRIFSWIHAADDEPPPRAGLSRDGVAQGQRKYWCVAIVASGVDKARAMSVVLQRSFLMFYKDSVAAAAKSTAQTAAAEAALIKRRAPYDVVGHGSADAYEKSSAPPRSDGRLSAAVAARAGSAAATEAGAAELSGGGLYADVEIAYGSDFAPSFGDVGTNIYCGSPSAPPSNEAEDADEFWASTLPIRHPQSGAGAETDVPITSL